MDVRRHRRLALTFAFAAGIGCAKKTEAAAEDASPSATIDPAAPAPAAEGAASAAATVTASATATATATPTASATAAATAATTARAKTSQSEEDARRDKKAAELAAQAEAMNLRPLGAAVTPGPGPTGAPTSTAVKVVPRRGDVQLGSITMTVPVPDGARIVAGLRPRFRQCYQMALAQVPDLGGKIVLQLNVRPDGEVASANVAASSGLTQSMDACLVRVAKNAMFGKPAASSTVSMPLTFVLLD